MWTKKQAKCVHTDLVWTKKHVHPTSKFTDFNETAAVLHRLKMLRRSVPRCESYEHLASDKLSSSQRFLADQ